jgi:hypothetical protein
MDYLHYDLGHQNAGAVVEVLSVAAIDQDREGETEQDLLAGLDHLRVGRLARVAAVLEVQPIPEHRSSVSGGRTARRIYQ